MKTKAILMAALATSASAAMAQSYTAVELAGGSGANAVSGGVSVGQTGIYESGRATIWDVNGVAADVHPSFLATSAGVGFSNILGRAGTLSVGLGQRNDAPNQAVAVRWQGTTPTRLADPFAIYSSVALATDGVQIVGWAAPMQTVRGQPSPGLMRAMIWDAASGRVVADLSGGRLMTAWAVAGGQQVGSESKGGATEARLWRGTADSVVSLHSKAYGYSEAYATDGTRQVGTVGVTVRVPGEGRRSPEFLLNSAAVWSGTAASLSILPYTASGFDTSAAVATGVSGDRVCGYGMGKSRTGVTQTTHALVWSIARRTWIDLHDALPAGYRDSRANGVDSSGNVTGYAVDASGASHAFLWRIGGV